MVDSEHPSLVRLPCQGASSSPLVRACPEKTTSAAFHINRGSDRTIMASVDLIALMVEQDEICLIVDSTAHMVLDFDMQITRNEGVIY